MSKDEEDEEDEDEEDEEDEDEEGMGRASWMKLEMALDSRPPSAGLFSKERATFASMNIPPPELLRGDCIPPKGDS